MPVRNQDHVHPVNFKRTGIRRIAVDPRVDQNDFTGGQPELICSVAEPRDFYHVSILVAPGGHLNPVAVLGEGRNGYRGVAGDRDFSEKRLYG